MKLERPDRVRIAVVALFAVLFGGVAALALRPRAPSREGPAQARGGLSTAEERASGAGDDNAPPGAPQGPSPTSTPATLRPRPPSVGDLPAPPTRPAAIAGRVVDPAGAPVEDAAIEVLPSGASRPSDPFGAQGVTRTGKDGRFVVDAAPLIRGDLQVAASRVGFLEGRSARLAPASPLDAGDIVVRPAGAGRLRPRFRERDAGPVAGDVLVTVVAQDGSASPARGTSRFTADAQGIGRPERALTAGYYRLTARLEGYDPATVPVTVGGDGALSEPEVVLSRATGLAVQIVDDATGLPVEEASVAWGPPGGAPASERVAAYPEGGTRLSAPPATAIQLELTAPRYRGWRVEGGAEGFDLSRGPLLTTPPAGHAETIVVRLTRGYSIAGVVRDAAGRPIAGASVEAFDGDTPAASTTTSAEGAYLLQGAGTDPLDGTVVLARREGYGWARAPVDLSPERPRAAVDIVLGAEEATLVVRVTGPGGAALELVRITVQPPGAAGAAVQDLTGGGGKCRFAGLGPGPVDVIASQSGLLPTRRAVVLRAGENALDIPLTPGAAISGVIVDESGNTLSPAGGWVTAEREAREEADGEPNAIAAIARDGTFRIDGLADGSYTVAVLASGFSMKRLPHVRPGPDTIRVIVVSALPLELVLRAPEGVPLPKRVTVTVLEGGLASEQSISVSAEGRVGPIDQRGAREVQVAAPGYVPGSAPIPSRLTEETRRIEVHLDRARTVRGRVLLPGGAPAVDAYLRSARAGEGDEATIFERVESVAEGRFTLTMAPREAILVEAFARSTPEASGGFEGRVTIPAGNGDVEEVVIHLARRPDAEPAK